MRKLLLVMLLASVAALALGQSALAAPSLSISKPPVMPVPSWSGPFAVDQHAIAGQWFQDISTSAIFARNHEFYDNDGSSGGSLNIGSDAVHGYVTTVIQTPPGGEITYFEIEAYIENDTPGVTMWPNGANSHNESLGTPTQYTGTLFNTVLTADFAVSDPTNAPATWTYPPYLDLGTQIIADNEDALGYYCWTVENPASHGGPGSPMTPFGNYYVPAYYFGNVAPGSTVGPITLIYHVDPPGLPSSDRRHLNIMRSFTLGDDIFMARSTSLKVSQWTDYLCVEGQAPLNDSNVSVFHNNLATMPVGSLTFARNIGIPNHFWGVLDDENNEMLSFTVTAGANEPVRWESLTLLASGSGDDSVDISQVRLWIDGNNNAIVDGGDTLIGSGGYNADEGTATIVPRDPLGMPFPHPYCFVPGGSEKFILSYTMNPATPCFKNYTFSIVTAQGVGLWSGSAVSILGLPLSGCLKTSICAVAVSSIGALKHLPVGTTVAYIAPKAVMRNFLAADKLVYIEEDNRSAGIGIYDQYNLIPPGEVHQGDRLAAVGTTFLLNGVELVMIPSQVLITHDTGLQIPKTIILNGRHVGGLGSGAQPPVMDGEGLSNVGLDMSTFGVIDDLTKRKRCRDFATNIGCKAAMWLNDGCGRIDTETDNTGAPQIGICIILPPDAPEGGPGGGPGGPFWRIKGTCRVLPDGAGNAINVIVPSSMADITQLTDF